jgi:hypothetical protein
LLVPLIALLVLLSAFPACAQELTFRTPPFKVSVGIDNQPITLTTTAVVSGTRDLFRLRLNTDLSDLQDHITGLLQAQLNRSDRCGERLSVENATLVPASPASLLTAHVHFERWVCVKLLGKETANRLVGGNGIVPVKLTPSVGEGNQVTLVPEVGQIEADGSLGEVLQSPSIRDKLRDKIGNSLLSAMQKAANLSAALPAGMEKVASVQNVQFVDGGSARLGLEVQGDVHISTRDLRALIDQAKAVR